MADLLKNLGALKEIKRFWEPKINPFVDLNVIEKVAIHYLERILTWNLLKIKRNIQKLYTIQRNSLLIWSVVIEIFYCNIQFQLKSHVVLYKGTFLVY